jgi:hypothetical protein
MPHTQASATIAYEDNLFDLGRVEEKSIGDGAEAADAPGRLRLSWQTRTQCWQTWCLGLRPWLPMTIL